jgi:hypothetical protein
MAEKKVEATRVARAVRVGGKEHRLEAVFESEREVGRFTIDGVKVRGEDFDRVLQLATAVVQ